MEIQGHTDSTGNDEANMILSEKRAKAVVNNLVSKGIGVIVSNNLSPNKYNMMRSILNK